MSGRLWIALVIASLCAPLAVGSSCARLRQRPWVAPALPLVSAAPLIAEGLQRWSAGDSLGARTAWTRALIAEPRNAAARNDLGILLMAEGRHGDALRLFQSAVQLAPGERLYRNNLAWAQRELHALASPASETAPPPPR